MTDPKWARATDHGRFYVDPKGKGGPLLPSVTNCIDHGSGLKGPGLIGWTARVTCDYAWQVLPRMVAALRDPAQRDELTKEIKNQRTVVRETASDLGSRIHRHAEAHLTGRALPDDEQVKPYVDQYVKFLHDFDVDITQHVEAAEATVFNRRVGYAGTLDTLLWLALDGVTPDGKVRASDERQLMLLDIKTSATKPDSTFYKDQALQLAALRYAETLLLPDDTEVPMPRVAGCALLNLRTGSYGFVPVPVGQKEFQAFQCAVGMTKWATTYDHTPKPVTAAGHPKRPPRKRSARTEVAA